MIGTLSGAITGAGGAWLLETQPGGRRPTGPVGRDPPAESPTGRFLASLADPFNAGTLMLARLNRRIELGETPDRGSAIERTHQLLAESASQAAAIVLIASTGISDKAWDAVKCSQSLLNLAIDHHTTESEDWKTSVANYRAARENFIAAARQELRMT
ncbi:MAG: hypothetical protein ACRD2W_24970 [Acidimicrobiales bacterium]